MKKVLIVALTVTLAAAAWASPPQYEYAGKWGSPGSGNGEFNGPYYLAMSPDGKRVYVADQMNNRVQYFKRRD